MMLKQTIYELLTEMGEDENENQILQFPDEDKSFTAKKLLECVNAAARGLLASGLKHGDRFAVCISNRSEWAILAVAASATGTIMVPINTSVRQNNLRYFLDKAGVKLIFYSWTYKHAKHQKLFSAGFKIEVQHLND